MEANPSPSEVAQAHLHAFLLDEHDPDVLAEAASHAGMGITDLKTNRPQFLTGTEGVAKAARGMYVFKWARDNPVGSPEAAEGLVQHLELNGGRLLHNTRGFFGDQTREQALWHQPISLTEPLPEDTAFQIAIRGTQKAA
jgi:hypothetical protein